MKTFYLLHQNRRVDRHFRKPESVVCAMFGAIREDLGPDHPDNRKRLKALDRLRALAENDDGLSFGVAGHVWKIRSCAAPKLSKAIQRPPERQETWFRAGKSAGSPAKRGAAEAAAARARRAGEDHSSHRLTQFFGHFRRTPARSADGASPRRPAAISSAAAPPRNHEHGAAA